MVHSVHSHMPRSIQLIYASTGGNTEIVMEKVAELLEKRGFAAQLHRAEQTNIAVIQDNQWFIMGTSTWEHGALNPFFRKLVKEFKEESLQGKVAAFVGLGDTRYEPVLFCEGIEKVKRAWESRDGESLGETLKINGEPYGLLDSDVTVWTETIIKSFEEKMSGTSGSNGQVISKVRSLLGV